MIHNKTKASEYRVRTLDRNDLNEKGTIYIGQGGTSTIDKVENISNVAAISKPDDDLNRSGYYALTLGGNANQDGIWGRFLHEVDCKITPTLFQLDEGATPYKYIIRGGYKSLIIKKDIFDSTLTNIMNYNSNLPDSSSSDDQKIFAKLSMKGFVGYDRDDTPFEIYSSFVASQKYLNSWQLYPLNFSPINITKVRQQYYTRNFQSIVFCSNDTPWQETADGFQLNLHAIGMGKTLEEQKLYYQINGVGDIQTYWLSSAVTSIRVTKMSIIF